MSADRAPAQASANVYRNYALAWVDFTTRAPAERYRYALSSPLTYLDPSGDQWLHSVSNYFAGFGDSATFGAAALIRCGIKSALGYQNDSVEYASTAYQVGEWSETAVELFFAGASAGLKVGARTLRHTR